MSMTVYFISTWRQGNNKVGNLQASVCIINDCFIFEIKEQMSSWTAPAVPKKEVLLSCGLL